MVDSPADTIKAVVDFVVPRLSERRRPRAVVHVVPRSLHRPDRHERRATKALHLSRCQPPQKQGSRSVQGRQSQQRQHAPQERCCIDSSWFCFCALSWALYGFFPGKLPWYYQYPTLLCVLYDFHTRTWNFCAS